MHIRVECYAGHRADQSPRRFELDEHVVEVEEIIDQWQGADYRYFKLRGDDRNLYILRLDEAVGQWDLTLFETPRGATIPEQTFTQLPKNRRPGKSH